MLGVLSFCAVGSRVVEFKRGYCVVFSLLAASLEKQVQHLEARGSTDGVLSAPSCIRFAALRVASPSTNQIDAEIMQVGLNEHPGATVACIT